jgi:hypothetical protein
LLTHESRRSCLVVFFVPIEKQFSAWRMFGV